VCVFADRCFCDRSVSNTTEKRKRFALGFNEKFDIIKRLRPGETATSIAQTCGNLTTANDIKRDARTTEQISVNRLYSVTVS